MMQDLNWNWNQHYIGLYVTLNRLILLNFNMAKAKGRQMKIKNNSDI